MQEQEFLRQLVKYPKETAQAEYKRAVLFKERDDFSAKLVRHILGHANAGGGYLIIGFDEDNKNRLIPEQVTYDICASYEVTTDRSLRGGPEKLCLWSPYEIQILEEIENEYDR